MTRSPDTLPAPPLDAAWTHYVLLADRAALPAITAWLARLPEDATAVVHVEIDHEDERVELPGDERIAVCWLERQGMPVAESGLLEDMLVEVELPDEDGVTCFWIATGAARTARMAAFLADDWGIDPAAIHVAPL